MSNFNKLLLSVSFIFILGSANAQKCKYQTNESDPITGEVIRMSHFEVSEGFWLYFNRTGDSYFIRMMYRHSGELNTTIATGHKLNLKLTNDQLVSILSTKESFPETKIGTGIITEYYVDYKCSKAQMELFVNDGISVVDANVLGKRFSKVLKEKRELKLKHRAACMITD